MGDEPAAMTTAPSEQALFAEALLRDSSSARASYLDAACGTDIALRQRVEDLILASENAGDFLEEPPAGLCANTDSTLVINELSEKPGDQIGRYKLLQQIGEGGCGVVYMAEQEKPIRRRVALKVIKLGMDTKSVIARFEAERQALALMDHPNIAKVLDAGATDTGRPYFVMELVRGIKITDYCDQNNLSTDERLRLFSQVCHAIQHAHQKGIIHRDIKPSNILVTVNEPGLPGNPKVIDFGIAKATTGERLTDKTVFTAFEQFMGTPAYMSPEQAVMTTLDVDTRTDIYALGVLLYELLTGYTPFDANNLMASGLDAMRRTILEVEPVKPSTRLTQALVAADVRRLNSKSALRTSHSAIPSDLDWIVMKALEKDRARRYETASGLATDIQHHLNDEPVIARPPGKFYKFQKLVRRNKLAFGAITGVSTALVLGLCVASWALVRERAARREAESARNLARAESARNEQVARFLVSTFVPGVWSGNETKLVRPILLDFFASPLGTDLTNQPSAQGDLWLSVANSCAAIRDYTRAVTNGQRAVNAYRLAFGEDHVKIARALWRLSYFQRHDKDLSGSKASALQAVAVARRCGDLDMLATCLLDAALSFTESGKPTPEAIPLLRETMRLRRHDVPAFLALNNSTLQLVRALRALAAEGKQEEAMAILQEELKEAPKDEDLLKLLRTFNDAPR